MTTRWSDVRRSKVPDEAAAQESGRALREALALSEIRTARGITQVMMARALETTQGSVSALEHRQDVFLSSLREYIEALGGELELTAVFDDDRIPVVIGEHPTA